MCGKFTILTMDEVLGIIQCIELDSPYNISPDWPAIGADAYPGSAVSVITSSFDTAFSHRIGQGSLRAQELLWGYDKGWDAKGLLFNTRIEGALSKSAWRDSMEHRRCLIPCRSFFETHSTETEVSPRTGKPIKRKYEFRLPDADSILIGGIWKQDRFSMVTTEANRYMAPIHHRMPVIVRPHEVQTWLGNDYMLLADRSDVALDVIA